MGNRRQVHVRTARGWISLVASAMPVVTRLSLEVIFSCLTGPFLRHCDELVLTSATGKVSRTLPSRSHTEAGTERKRAQRACQQCHIHKTKCSGDLPACKRCTGAGLACEYLPAKRKFAAIPHNNLTQLPVKSEAAEPANHDSPRSRSQSEAPQPNVPVTSTGRVSSLDESDVEQLLAE
jgi:hypothetical protein